MNRPKNQFLLWLDLEMTGLSVDICRIMEVGYVITDFNFKCIHQHNVVIHCNHKHIQDMDSWCYTTHTENGLIDECLHSSNSIETAEMEVIEDLSTYFTNPITICGNCIWHDRIFIKRYMPKLHTMLGHPMLDVHSFRILHQDKHPTSPPFYHYSLSVHRALPDAIRSIKELQMYLKQSDTCDKRGIKTNSK